MMHFFKVRSISLKNLSFPDQIVFVLFFTGVLILNLPPEVAKIRQRPQRSREK